MPACRPRHFWQSLSGRLRSTIRPCLAAGLPAFGPVRCLARNVLDLACSDPANEDCGLYGVGGTPLAFGGLVVSVGLGELLDKLPGVAQAIDTQFTEHFVEVLRT